MMAFEVHYQPKKNRSSQLQRRRYPQKHPPRQRRGDRRFTALVPSQLEITLASTTKTTEPEGGRRRRTCSRLIPQYSPSERETARQLFVWELIQCSQEGAQRGCQAEGAAWKTWRLNSTRIEPREDPEVDPQRRKAAREWTLCSWRRYQRNTCMSLDHGRAMEETRQSNGVVIHSLDFGGGIVGTVLNDRINSHLCYVPCADRPPILGIVRLSP
ncbi:uncharacterized protein LOC133498466 isoform X2 [Syngnathoides biaculeatus]|uniref:uncharacterized protein LOC133498466 isoform X2 n=1 Tax=Syngnathoides biaculeatus TaxID=300417 RepID=UPI002ADE9541|nr:uncharacterized protein LOC133498466 isoform X2 [Syngnathoides biaculeatus]